MRNTCKFAVACVVTVVLLAAAGCGGNGEQGEEADTAAADGTSGGAGGTGNTESGENASLAGTSGTTPPGMPPATANPVVLIKTSMGDITVELDDDNAPLTVENFLRYAESGFYDKTVFHQVFKGAVIMGGMLNQDMTEKEAGPPVNNEAHNGLTNQRGTIAMARQHDVINSATCQFFINVKDNPNYDHRPGARVTYDNPQDYGYCVFGRVTPESMGVVDQIADVEVQDTAEFERTPVRTVLIESIRKVR